MPTNWATTPMVQQRTRELEEARQFWNQLLGGQVPLEGLSTQQRAQLANILGDVASQYPEYDISKAVNTYVRSALTGNAPTALRNAALTYFGNQAANLGQWTPELASYFATRPTSTADILTRGQILGKTAEQLYGTPEWQQAYSAFKTALAPSGNVAAAGVPGWAALAQPYFQLQQINPELAARLGEVQFPTDATNLSRYAQDVLKGIGEAGLAAQGLVPGPAGPVRETPLERVQRALGDLWNVVQEFIAPALSKLGGGVPSVPSNYPRTAGPPVPETRPARPEQESYATQIKQWGTRNAGSAEEFKRWLNANDARLKAVFDYDVVRDLWNFADTNTKWAG